MKIYVLKDPRNDQIRYVGVTTQKLSQRLSQHINAAKNNEQRHVCKWIKSLLKIDLKPIIEQIDEVSDNNWEKWEIYYIAHYKEIGCNLTNIDKGGKGVITAEKRSKSSMERTAEAHKKPIYQMNEKLEIIKEWKSTADACRELGFKFSNIGNATKYKRAAYGFFWCKVSDYSGYKPKSKYINQKGHKQIKIQS